MEMASVGLVLMPVHDSSVSVLWMFVIVVTFVLALVPFFHAFLY